MGGNLGPPLNDDIKLQFIMVNIRDLLETLRTMPLVDRGYYVTALFVMYERMGMLPADDKKAAMAMGIDVRQYRFLKPKMIETGRFRETADGFTNDRVQSEITAAVRKIRAKQDAAREAALTREAKKRDERSRVADTTQPKIDERSMRDRREIDERSPRSVGDTGGDFSKKHNKIKGRLPQTDHIIDKDIDTDKDNTPYSPPLGDSDREELDLGSKPECEAQA
jgi:uncharacterized protein YdaU (DUF1376 family)